MISANVGLIKGFSFQHNHIISYLQITEANILYIVHEARLLPIPILFEGNLIILRGKKLKR